MPVFLYADAAKLELHDHVVPVKKYSLLLKKLQSDKRFKKHRFNTAQAVSETELLTVHTPEYLHQLFSLRPTHAVEKSELPLTPEILQAFLSATGGTIAAGFTALQEGSAFNLSGGFHHAFADHAEGFCFINDVAVAVKMLRQEAGIRHILIIDLDVHQGNGTAHIFEQDRNVFTFSMHEEDNYPKKENGSLDIGLSTGCNDKEYLKQLESALSHIRKSFTPDLIFYLAGVDVFADDQLGGLNLTYEGILKRDIMVRDFMPEVPMVTVMAGGYARDVNDTVNLHFQTCEVLAGFK